MLEFIVFLINGNVNSEKIITHKNTHIKTVYLTIKSMHKLLCILTLVADLIQTAEDQQVTVLLTVTSKCHVIRRMFCKMC
jgi:hypothetical protein